MTTRTLTLTFAALSASLLSAADFNNQARINQGIRSGQLNRPEAIRLQVRQNAIQREIRQDSRDGHGLTRNEARGIRQDQRALSNSIYRQKRDAQARIR